MFDTMTMTKTIGALCGALLIFMLGNWVASALYATGAGGHGDEHHQAYVIEVEGGEEKPAEEEGPTFEELLASADAGAGSKVFSKCKSCHKIGPGENATGPTLHAVVGRPIDSVDGFAYSGALEAVGDVWSPENLNAFLADPKGTAPGTKMSFAGLKKAKDRANLIAYLETLN